jgi:hypothetical protein
MLVPLSALEPDEVLRCTLSMSVLRFAGRLNHSYSGEIENPFLLRTEIQPCRTFFDEGSGMSQPRPRQFQPNRRREAATRCWSNYGAVYAVNVYDLDT